MARILVTGGAGFIGSNLCSKLVKDKTVLWVAASPAARAAQRKNKRKSPAKTGK